MSMRYVVKQGDYLAKIAYEHGLTDFMAVWNAGENAELRAKRKSPNVLFPGDVVMIPDRATKRENGSTEERHRFVVKGTGLKLRIVVEDVYRAPVRNARCELDVTGSTDEVKTDGDGRIERPIPKNTEEERFVVRTQDTAFKDVVLNVRVGELDPIDTVIGQAKRLVNLGYLAELTEDRDAPAFLSAVQEFQCDETLVVDGRCGPVTQANLEKVHGS